MTDDEVEKLMLSDAEASGGASGNLAGSDAGPGARRAAVGMSPGPREYSDEDLGLRGGPLVDTSQRFGASPGETTQMAFSPKKNPKLKPQTEMEGDPLAQMVATGAVLGPVGNMIRMLPGMGGLMGGAAVGAGEGAAASGMTGGDVSAGGGIGALLGMLNPMARLAQSSRGAAAREVLDDFGAPVKPQQGTFGTPPPEMHPEVTGAQKALEFQAPTMHEAIGALGGSVAHQLLGHNSGLLTPLAIAHFLVRNAAPIQGRILAPLSTMAEGSSAMIPGAAAAQGQHAGPRLDETISRLVTGR